MGGASLEGRPGTSLGLITNELCSNALKHGKGKVELTFTLQGDTAQLQVCDDGPGFGADFRPRQAARTGLHFIEDLTHHDLQGNVRYENRGERGARIIITRPHKPHIQAVQ
jgi:two-component sensor histidine kinase